MAGSISHDMLSLGIIGGICILGMIYYTGISTKKSMGELHSLNRLLESETNKYKSLIKYESLNSSDKKSVMQSIKHQTKTRGRTKGGKKTKKITFL